MSLTLMPMPQGSDSLEQDERARIDALDPSRSFLVQAPAGSGKTELLTQRLLALLSVVEKPEQVLAITFTVAATAEMRRRVIGALEKAQKLLAENPAGLHEREQHALAALKRSRRMGWNLLEQPQRLNIQTIDSLCLRIAHEAPLLSRLGGRLQPTDDVDPLYSLAARRTMEQLGGANSELARALEQLLRLRGVNLRDCEKLIGEMLRKRDQWLEEFSTARTLSENEWAELREKREEPFRREHERVSAELRGLIAREPNLFHELLELASYACGNEPTEAIHELANVNGPDGLQELLHFTCLRDFLLTKGGTWRKNANKNLGFPAAAGGGSAERKAAFEQLIQNLHVVEGLREALNDTRSLPNLSYTDEEWQTIRGVFTVLLHAAAELRVVFAERSVIDFVEAGITAEHALREDETRKRWSEKIHHLLVDEFQDTSRRQYTLLKDIVREWDMSENRTCFLVGDPMQSIYLFRSAELALFDEVQLHGFGQDVEGLHFTHLKLTRNFRSTAGIVEPINAMFEKEIEDGAAGAARFTPALANAGTSATSALHLHANFEDDHSLAMQAEAQTAVSIISRHLPALQQARADGREFRIGLLVRARKHLTWIAAALREANIPYRAVDIETLDQRQEIQDLCSLMRALIYPMDRVAWLSVLRAPWCGLSLADLHIVSGSDEKALQRRPVRSLLAQRAALLSEDGRRRLQRLQSTIEHALESRFAGPFSASPHGFAAWIEQTWLALGGAHCVDAGQSENVQAFFRLLAQFKPGGLEASQSIFDQRLAKLFAQPDPRAPENCSIQLMTIHKAKGLGFDVVLVPRLHESLGKGSDDTPLLRWLVRKQYGSDQRELLMAPIGLKGGTTSPTYKWLRDLQKQDELEEMHRLLYVACTRARTELNLLANLKVKHSRHGVELVEPSSHRLLKCGWGYLSELAQPGFIEYLALRAASATPPPQPGVVLQMAAATQPPAQQIKRLPTSWFTGVSKHEPEQPAELVSEEGLRPRVGSLASRARGTVVHALFESLASLPIDDARRNVVQSLAHWKNVATAMLRHAGLYHRELYAELKTILSLLQNAAKDPNAQWILGQRAYAQSESSWTTQDEDGALTILRCDRAFLAGADPLSEGEDYLWIVDYKTAEGDDVLLLDERKRYEPQLQRYALALRGATQSTLPLRLALYYPAIPHLLWWEA